MDEKNKNLRFKVLLVEDDHLFRALLRSIFQAEGWIVREAGNGNEALQSLESEEKPDLIVTDLNMPELDGIGLLEALPAVRGLDQAIVVVCSAVEIKPQDLSRISERAHLFLRKGQYTTSDLADELRMIATSISRLRTSQLAEQQQKANRIDEYLRTFGDPM